MDTETGQGTVIDSGDGMNHHRRMADTSSLSTLLSLSGEVSETSPSHNGQAANGQDIDRFVQDLREADRSQCQEEIAGVVESVDEVRQAGRSSRREEIAGVVESADEPENCCAMCVS